MVHGYVIILSAGDKVFIVTRRHFEGDTRRHFVGEVAACTENSVRVTGHAYIANGKNGFDRKPEERTRILNRLHLSDGKDFVYDVDEFRSE